LVLVAQGADPLSPGVPRLDGTQTVPALRLSASPAPAGLNLQYEQPFQSPQALQDFVLTDPAAWMFTQGTTGGALELKTQSNYQPDVQSPVNIALLADRQFGDFVLDCDLLQSGKEYGHRDMCLFFGFQNPTNFYYVHIATEADDHAHNIFVVRNAPRTKIARETTRGVNWGLEIWHRVRLERRVTDGTIKVWFDDLTTPIMTAVDKSFGSGHLGFGSFDDTGRITNIRVWSPTMDRSPTAFFKRP
jgi:hypothetical protein